LARVTGGAAAAVLDNAGCSPAGAGDASSVSTVARAALAALSASTVAGCPRALLAINDNAGALRKTQ